MGEWSGLVVYAAATSWDGNWGSDQHIASRLTRYAPVLYVDPALSRLTALRQPELAPSLRRPRLRTIAPRLARLTPVVPPKTSASVLRPVAEAVTRTAVGRAVRALGGDVHAVVAAGFTRAFGVGERRRVFYATDDFVAGADLVAVDAARARRLEERQLAAVDTVVAVSEELADRYAARGIASVVVPNGCDDVMFAGTDAAPLPDDVRLPPPVAGFIGHLAERIDVALLEAVADRDHSLLLVGPRSPAFELARLERLLSRPNVQWVGPKPFARLPSYLRLMDVGMLPYADSVFNRASFPLKTLEYLAGGRAVVATDLPAIRWLDTDLVAVARDPGGFADAVGRELSAQRTPALVAARQELAARHGWDGRAEAFARAIGLRVPAHHGTAVDR